MQQLQQPNEFLNLKFKDLSKKQKILLLIAGVFTIFYIVFLCFLVKIGVDLSRRRIITLLSCIPIFIFLIIDFYFVVVPDKEVLVSKIRPIYYYLEDYGYEYSGFYYNKKKKIIEIYYTNPDLLNVIFFAYLKEHGHWPYISSEDTNYCVSIEYLYKILKNENKNIEELSVKDMFEFILDEIKSNKKYVLNVINLVQHYSEMGLDPFSENKE